MSADPEPGLTIALGLTRTVLGSPAGDGSPGVVLDRRRHLMGLSIFGRDGEGLNFGFHAYEFSR